MTDVYVSPIDGRTNIRNGLPEEIVLDPGREAEREWRAAAVQLYDRLDHAQRVEWACDCIEHAPETDGAHEIVRKIRGLSSARIDWPYAGTGRTGLLTCLQDLREESGLFQRPGIGVASWCQVLAGDAAAERDWQLEQLRAIAG